MYYLALLPLGETLHEEGSPWSMIYKVRICPEMGIPNIALMHYERRLLEM